jgi:hypothetical protein
MADESDSRRFRWLLGSILASGLALTAGASALRGSRAGSSVAVGVAVAALNFVALRFIVRALTAAAAGTGKSGGIVTVLLSMKLAILLAAVWLLLSRHMVSAGPLALGYVALPIGVAIGTLLCDKAHAPPED